VLFVLGLVIVAALSSLVWWSIRSDPDETRFSSADRPSSSGGAADDSRHREELVRLRQHHALRRVR